jgi:hypothetical protein
MWPVTGTPSAANPSNDAPRIDSATTPRGRPVVPAAGARRPAAARPRRRRPPARSAGSRRAVPRNRAAIALIHSSAAPDLAQPGNAVYGRLLGGKHYSQAAGTAFPPRAAREQTSQNRRSVPCVDGSGLQGKSSRRVAGRCGHALADAVSRPRWIAWPLELKPAVIACAEVQPLVPVPTPAAVDLSCMTCKREWGSSNWHVREIRVRVIN